MCLLQQITSRIKVLLQSLTSKDLSQKEIIQKRCQLQVRKSINGIPIHLNFYLKGLKGKMIYESIVITVHTHCQKFNILKKGNFPFKRMRERRKYRWNHNLTLSYHRGLNRIAETHHIVYVHLVIEKFLQKLTRESKSSKQHSIYVEFQNELN